jgi:hypothetical protein
MNTITDPRQKLTAANADRAHGPKDCGDTVKRSWEWQLGPDAFGHLVHVRPVYRSQGRPTWGASLVVWDPQAGEFSDPIVELYSPQVSTQARALEWLNAALADAKRPA